jgi:predicted enzyme related to lactoylglutathione lyase
VTTALKTVIHPVRDLAAATAVYRALLGVEPTMDQPYYVGFDVGGQHLGLDPHGHDKGMTGPVTYWHVDDVTKTLEQLTGAGAEPFQPVSDVGGGKLVATVRDADGNVFGLIQEP